MKIVQAVIDPDTPEAFARCADSACNEYVLSITYCVRNRPGVMTNDKMISATEILAKEIEVLNAAATPPFQIDDENISENVRLTNCSYRLALSG